MTEKKLNRCEQKTGIMNNTSLSTLNKYGHWRSSYGIICL